MNPRRIEAEEAGAAPPSPPPRRRDEGWDEDAVDAEGEEGVLAAADVAALEADGDLFAAFDVSPPRRDDCVDDGDREPAGITMLETAATASDSSDDGTEDDVSDDDKYCSNDTGWIRCT